MLIQYNIKNLLSFDVQGPESIILPYTGSETLEILAFVKDDGYSGFSDSFSDKAVRLGFIRKVYSILCAQVNYLSLFFILYSLFCILSIYYSIV